MLRMLQLIGEEVTDCRSRWKERSATVSITLEEQTGDVLQASAETLRNLAPDLTQEQAVSALVCALLRNGIYERVVERTLAGKEVV